MWISDFQKTMTVKKARTILVTGTMMVLVTACQTVSGLPRLMNPAQPVPAKTASQTTPQTPQGTNAQISPQPSAQQPGPQIARVQPIRPRLQTGSRLDVRGDIAARPPLLPSLEDLLGRMPRAQDGAVQEPPPLPTMRGRRVAILLPLSGSNQRLGQALLSAAEMALFDFANNTFELLVQDTKGTEAGAAEAARLAIGDGASLIVGPLLASSVRAVSDVARVAAVPVLAFSSDRTVVGNGVYTMGFFPDSEVRRVVSYAFAQGSRRFALLAPRGAYAERVLNALQNTVSSLGGEVTRVQFYTPNATDFADPVKRIANYPARRQALLEQRRQLQDRGDEVALLALKRLKNLQTIGDPPFDALLVADGGKRLVAVAAMLPFYDIDPNKIRILGTGEWDGQSLGAEPALVGGWYAAPDPKQRQAFSDKFQDAFGKRPHRLATLAYDAMALAVVLGQRDGPQAYDPAILTASGGYTGRDGIFRFDADGAVERGLAVMKVDRKKSQVIDPAPQSFVN